MLVVADSVFDGTWASGQLPEELRDYLLMKYMRWSWEQLEATPLYVRRFTWDLMQAEITAQNDEMSSARRKQEAARA